MTVTNVPATDQEGGVDVFEWTRAEYRRAVKSALDDMGITYRQLRAMARKDQFVSLRARRLWLMTKHSGSGW
jgi:hypothetical protein